MSLANYTDLTTAIGNWLQRQDIIARFPDFIALFESCANRRLRVRQQETISTLTPAAGVIALPSDFLTWRRVTWLGNPRRELSYVEPSWLQSAYPDNPTDLPSVFTIEAANIKMMPTDDTNTNIELSYWAQIPSLQSNTTNWLMTAHPDLYLFGSLAEAGGYTVDVDKLAMWKSRRDELFDEIDKLDKKARAPSQVRVMSPTP
jgi:hypothetical protein